MKKLKKIKHLSEIKFALLEDRTVFLATDVDRYSVTDTIISLQYLQALNNKPIKLYINSPGGSVDSGLALYDAIKNSKSPIHTVCNGLAASMGAVLLGAGKKGHRYANKHARIMIHQPSGGFIGKSSDMENYASEIVRMRKLINELLAKDTGQTVKKVSIDTEKDFFMTADEALKYGLIDKII